MGVGIMRAVDAVNAVRAVQAVQAVIAVDIHKGKIPPNLRHLTFFGKHDLWRYVEKSDERLCPLCEFYATKLIFFGDALRYFFPYLEIMDEDTIRVNTHPNCRCVLKRVESAETHKS